MISVIQVHATDTTPPPKKQRIEKPTPQVNPPPQVNLFEIEDSDLEEETLLSSFACPIIVPITLLAMVSVTQRLVDPLEGVVDNDSFYEIHLS